MMLERLAAAVALTETLACGGASGNRDAAMGDARGGSDGPTACTAAGPIAVDLVADDKVRLAADLYTTGTTGAPGVILLHMIPPSNTKANYPRAFIDPLVARGFQVLNVNRRGAYLVMRAVSG